LLYFLAAATAFVLRSSIRKMLGTGHARPVKALLALTLAVFTITLVGLIIVGLIF
jgi:hypothetical protein